MRKHFGFLFFLLLLSLATPQARPQKQKSVAIVHITVIDATGAPARPDMTVIISGDRISEIGKSTEVHIPKDAQKVEAAGKFLIPGLWDMHVHWSNKEYLPLFLANGVTGIRIMWGFPDHFQWRKEIEAGRLLGPHMVIASPIVDGPVPLWPGSIAVHSESEARQTVREIKKEGADFVKVYSFLPRDAYFAIADEAKKQDLTFAGHVPFGVSVEEASDAGQKSMEHLTGIADSCSNHAEELHRLAAEDLAEMIASGKPSLAGGSHLAASGLSPLDSYNAEKCAAVFARFKKNETWVCPTLVLFRTMAMADDPSLVNDERLKYMPRQLRESWDPKTNYLFKMAAMNRSYVKKQYQFDLDLVAALDKTGVGLIAGTDTSNPYSMPGFSLLDELAHYVEAGLPPMAALQTATRNPARFLGKEKDLGTIEQGKIADLVLLDANPLEDVRNIKKIAAVIFEGKMFRKSAIDGMLADAEKLASRKSIAETLFRTIQEKDVDAALKQYRVLKTTQPAAYEFSEEELNVLGYRLLGMKKNRGAIEVFKLCVEEYPESSNAFDSLGEAYMNNGEKDLAIKNYEKSLQLDPKNFNAVEMLKKLRTP
jgi:imidazolonepropionase-like amidohydrolase